MLIFTKYNETKKNIRLHTEYKHILNILVYLIYDIDNYGMRL